MGDVDKPIADTGALVCRYNTDTGTHERGGGRPFLPSFLPPTHSPHGGVREVVQPRQRPAVVPTALWLHVPAQEPLHRLPTSDRHAVVGAVTATGGDVALQRPDSLDQCAGGVIVAREAKQVALQ